jgi:hypothetical protein
MRYCPPSKSHASRAGPFSHGQEHDLGEHAAKLLAVLVVDTNKTELTIHFAN